MERIAGGAFLTVSGGFLLATALEPSIPWLAVAIVTGVSGLLTLPASRRSIPTLTRASMENPAVVLVLVAIFAGGAITATAHRDGLLTTTDVSPGDHLYLTKPLGTQPAMGALRVSDGEFAETVADAIDPDIEAVGQEAYRWMVHPNRAAALAVRELATAATDVTGFGLLGEASTIAARSGVGIELTALPVIEGTPSLSGLFGYGLVAGESAETSGGLLVAVEDDRTAALEAALDEADVFYRAVGRVTEGAGARLAEPAIDQISLGTAPRPD